MRNLLAISSIGVLSKLSVRFARKYLHHTVCESILPMADNSEKQLLVDVSVIINNDARTGIQRVVRALLQQLLIQPVIGYRVRPVFATRKHEYHYAPDCFGLTDYPTANLNETSAVKVGSGDMFLGLDLAAHLLPLHRTQLAKWKRLGAEIHIVVYDLLPVLHPQWFNTKTTKNFHRWLRAIAVFADSVICISNTVKKDLDDWLNHNYSLATGTIPIRTIPLGADISASVPSRGLPENINQLLVKFVSKPTVLMVGTLEPRKGHSQILAAFDKLWQRGREINLVIVGKAGWKTEALQQALRTHPQNNNYLYWLDNASDELLELLYGSCTGVIVASLAEGFGLPLIEARHFNKPVLARDIPVLREIGGNAVAFFSGASTEDLLSEIQSWLNKITVEPIPFNVPQQTWQYSANELLIHLELGQPADAMHHQGQVYQPLAQVSLT
jgi:glycosyltransferase involved in cell wall biosynthesis